MDLSFKMVAGQTSVFIISAWNETIQRKHILLLSLTTLLLTDCDIRGLACSFFLLPLQIRYLR